MQLVQTVAPSKEPLTLEEVKGFLKILDMEDDVLIESLIIAVREHIENVTNRQLEVATFELMHSSFVCKLPKGSLQSIDSIKYLDEKGDYLTLDPSQYYKYSNLGIGKIEYLSVPKIVSHKEAIKITFTAGYLLVPTLIKHYMKVKIATLYENREEFIVGASVSDIGSSLIEGLLDTYKIRNI